MAIKNTALYAVGLGITTVFSSLSPVQAAETAYASNALSVSQQKSIDIKLRMAVRSGDIEEAAALLDKGANIDSQDSYGFSALMYAANRGDLDMVTFLLKREANPSVRTKRGATALIICSATLNNNDVINELIDYGANVNARKDDGDTALINSIIWSNKDATMLLLSKGADPNLAHHETGITALMWAAKRGDEDTVHALIKYGADIDAVAKNGIKHIVNSGETAADVAARWGNDNIVKILEEAKASMNAAAPAPSFSP